MSFDRLPEFQLDAGSAFGAEFLLLGLETYHAAARFIRDLPYGRTSDRADFSLVLRESRGTCSTKHALLAALARSHGYPVELTLGIYEMDGSNTPGIAAVLERHALPAIPEAHCYLRYTGTRIDLTRAVAAATPIDRFLLEESIEPQQIGDYKSALHQRFLRDWAAQRNLDFAAVWQAREECIAALAEADRMESERR